ncbi:MAG: SPOR domain-containing protein [Brevinema sp.]
MARIKFLDILEETKTKPVYNTGASEIPTIEKKRERHSLSEESGQEKIAYLRERSLLRDSGYQNSNPPLRQKSKSESPSFLARDDSKVILTGALFVLFGGMLFLSGYWVGKTITNNVKVEREALMAQSFNDFKKSETIDVPNLPTAKPMASTVDTIPIPQNPIKVIEPEPLPTAKKPVKAVAPVRSREYIVQISAHSTIDAARLVEDQLRSAGFSAYTSESLIGDAVFFRVRVRGFSNKKTAQDVLAQIKAKDLGQDGFVLTLE